MYDPLISKRQQFLLATQVVRMILRVDDVIGERGVRVRGSRLTCPSQTLRPSRANEKVYIDDHALLYLPSVRLLRWERDEEQCPSIPEIRPRTALAGGRHLPMSHRVPEQ